MADYRRPKAPGIPGVSLPPPGDWRERQLERELAEERAKNAALRERPVSVSSKPPSSGSVSVISWLKAAPPWAIGVIAILLVGGSTLQSIAVALGPKPATAEQQQASLELQRATDEKLVRLDRKLDAAIAKGERRDNLQAEWACRNNGPKPAPIARGAPCGELVLDPPPLGATGPWTARAEWPP